MPFLFIIPLIFSVIGFFVVLVDGFYIVEEGNAAVITRWGKAVGQEEPSGLKMKAPIMTGVVEFDTRERLLTVPLSAATSNQLPITATVSVNWRIDENRVLEIFSTYGTPERFEATVLTARLGQAAKAALSRFQASDLIGDRTSAAAGVLTNLVAAIEGAPISISSAQIDDVDLPPAYLESILAKEKAREDAARERYALERQALEAQQQVQSAEAERDAAIATADGRAAATRTQAAADAEATVLQAEAAARSAVLRGEAEAKALEAIAMALQDNPLLIDYQRAKAWDGAYPTTTLADAPGMLMGLPDGR